MTKVSDLEPIPGYGYSLPAKPVAMPSEEEIARVLCKLDGFDPDERVIGGQATGFYDFGRRWQAEEMSENTLGGRNYVREARAVLALFAPILAEKERVEREWTSEKERADMAAAQMVKQNDRVRELVALLDKQMGTPCEQIRHRQQIYEERETNALALSCWQDAARALEAERDALKARALAAEAALAAERERCAKVAEGHDGLHCGSLLEGQRAEDYDCGQIDASTSIAAAIRAQE